MAKYMSLTPFRSISFRLEPSRLASGESRLAPELLQCMNIIEGAINQIKPIDCELSASKYLVAKVKTSF